MIRPHHTATPRLSHRPPRPHLQDTLSIARSSRSGHPEVIAIDPASLSITSSGESGNANTASTEDGRPVWRMRIPHSSAEDPIHGYYYEEINEITQNALMRGAKVRMKERKAETMNGGFSYYEDAITSDFNFKTGEQKLYPRGRELLNRRKSVLPYMVFGDEEWILARSDGTWMGWEGVDESLLGRHGLCPLRDPEPASISPCSNTWMEDDAANNEESVEEEVKWEDWLVDDEEESEQLQETAVATEQ